MTIHTIGCSFTNWVYPTWSDYIDFHYYSSVVNLGWPGAGNDIIKKHLYTIDQSDHVIIMFSGYDRLTVGVDEGFISNKPTIIKNFNNEKQVFFKNNHPQQGFARSKHSGNDYSLFHLIYNMLENILDCQNILTSKRIDYTFCLWQSINNKQPGLRALDPNIITKFEYENFTQNPIFKKVLDSIDMTKFLQPLDFGIWEHLISKKSLVLAQSPHDLHPSSLANFDYFRTYMKSILDDKFDPKNNLQELEKKAKVFSEHYAKLSPIEMSSIFDLEISKSSDMDDAKKYFFGIWDKE